MKKPEIFTKFTAVDWAREGVREVKVFQEWSNSTMMSEVDKGNRMWCKIFYASQLFDTREEAIQRAEQLREKRVKSLHKQADKYSALKFT